MKTLIFFIVCLVYSISDTVAQSTITSSWKEKFRIQYYEAYPPVEETAKRLKISNYNSFENPTGIYFNIGDKAYLKVHNTQKQKISLRVHSFEKDDKSDKIYPLHEGINEIEIQNKGLGYINFYTSDWYKISPVRIEIEGGKINGYFDKNNHTNKEWQELLSGAVCNVMDIKGDYINLAYWVSSLKKYCPVKGWELISFYDKIVDLQHEMMGLKKYNIRPKNHMFAREVKSGLFADGLGAGFAQDCMNKLANVDNINKGVWAIAHELGHVNQIRPGLKWVSTTEVTNNIYSVWARYLFEHDYRNLEQERHNDGDGNIVLGGRFNSYLNYGIVKGEQWLCQKGPDKMKDYENGGDHFVKLCPLWQIQLYYAVAGPNNYWANPDWFADVAQIVRNTNEKELNNGELQINFMKNVCDVVKEDLTDFFVKTGMLKPINKEMDDYSRGQLTITEEQCNNLKKYASRYPKPASPVIYYISANSIEAFRKRLPVEGEYGKGISFGKDKCTISHNYWKNVVVFETYKGKELTHVSMVGTDSPDRSTTFLQYPEGSTRIEAVSWDGKRTLLYGKR